MNLTFKIRVNINKDKVGTINGYPAFATTYNSHFQVLQREKDYLLMYKLPNAKKLVAIATTKANIKENIKQYLAKQQDDEAKELLKMMDHENY